MNIQENVSLAAHSTMRLGGKAKYLAEVNTEAEVIEAIAWARGHAVKLIAIGKGSNIVWQDSGFDGLVLVIRILGKRQLDDLTLEFGAGEIWDEAVAHSVELGLSGLELMSLVPGTVGATPVQNVGAYGTEISKTLVDLDAYDLYANEMVTLNNNDCAFSYRNSRFKSADRGRFIITSLRFRLKSESFQPPFYDSLQRYITAHNITDFSPASLRQAVIAIRSAKLPDPGRIPNNGSFFANPIVEQELFNELKARFPGLVAWDLPDGHVKLAAGWLIEQAGFLGAHDEATGMAIWPTQALVLVNEHASKTSDLLDFRDRIITKVRDMFGVDLQQEPELIS